MELTAMNFDLNPETFTLQNMFAMELHRFSEVIADITGSATKELSIEKGICGYCSLTIISIMVFTEYCH